MKTIFQKIADGEIPAEILRSDRDIVAFRDVNPQAPQHILIIPRRPIPTLNDLQPADVELLGRMVLTASQLAAELGIAEGGYRLVFNCGADAGQEVFHLHLHLLGGRKMKWPPG